jgi:hypothetical protein
LAKLGIFVVNYIDDIIGVAPDDVADVHFKVTLKVLHLMGFIISKNKTVPPGKIVTCLGIVINLELGCLSIPSIKLNQVVNLCSKYLNKKSILKRDLQALLGSLLFLHKAIKPARTLVNRALAVLRGMGEGRKAAISEGMKRDLLWFIACSQQINARFFIFKDNRPHAEIYVDAIGGVYQNRVYSVPIGKKEGWSINQWEALNMLVALRTWASVLQAIARNLWLFQATGDCALSFAHISGSKNLVADLLSRWAAVHNPHAKLFFLLNDLPVWDSPPEGALHINYDI